MRRREVIALVATGGALPLGARGQARGAPVIGILSSASAAPFAQLEAAFRPGSPGSRLHRVAEYHD
jgi:hypothetical protein